jgi:polar amino acid transport system ATP-binding protein/sulfate transport system ATP-binding protein
MTTVPEYSLHETLLTIDHVSVKYGDTLILRDVQAEVKNIKRPGCSQGQVVGFLGPSGVGKSTLFSVLAGLEQPDFGKVLITADQKPVNPGDMGVVFQNYQWFKNYTVMGNMLVAGEQAGMSAKDAKEKAMALLEEFGLPDKADYYWKGLSGGQRQRVAIAQQLMCSGHFLLMDEPFSGLDPIMKDRCCGTIQKIAAKDELNTIIVITHDIRAALAVSDHLWLLGREYDADGKMVPGAYIKKTYDLIERGLAWHPDVVHTKEFGETYSEIDADFATL